MPFWMYEAGPNGLGVFLLVTVVLGGGAAWISGRVIAQTWRPAWHIPGYMLLMTASVRFLHFALFEEPLLPIMNWVVDYLVLLIAAGVGYRRMRALQVANQYHWLFEQMGALGWRRKPS
jgi:hypothetical protein